MSLYKIKRGECNADSYRGRQVVQRLLLTLPCVHGVGLFESVLRWHEDAHNATDSPAVRHIQKLESFLAPELKIVSSFISIDSLAMIYVWQALYALVPVHVVPLSPPNSYYLPT